jgi:serine/threonine protein phosphatase PrpC
MNLKNKTACIVKNDRLMNINLCACGTACFNDCTIVVVCNGIGEGKAAEDTVNGMLAHFKTSPWCCRSNMEVLVNQAQLNLLRTGEGCRTTFAAVLASKGKVIVAHAGNTRIFLAGDSGLIYISKDHSAGELLNEPDKGFDKRLYSALGIEDERFIYEIREYNTLSMRKALLCTDGYMANSDDEWIMQLLSGDRDAAKLIDELDRKTGVRAVSNRAAAAIQL